jgi:DNA-binding NtrC family response regulator
LLSLYVETANPWNLITAQSVAETSSLVTGEDIDCALLDLELPDGNGLRLGQRLKSHNANLQVIIMTGGALTMEEDETCRKEDFQIIHKPFLAGDIVALLDRRKRAVSA